jgi:hypothetical protein
MVELSYLYYFYPLFILNSMKKLIYMSLVLFVFKLPVTAQTYTWIDSFDNGQAWTLDSNWTVAAGKLEFYWSPQIPDFDLRAVSPVISLPENVFDLTVTQYLDVFSGTGTEFAEINLIVGGNHEQLWNYNLIGGTWGNGNGEDLSLVIDEYAGQDVQLEFRTYGQDTYNWNWWDVFEVKISAYFDHDMTITSITGPTKIELFETGTWSLQVKNMGSQIQDEFSVKLFDIKTGDKIGSIENPGSISPQEIVTFNFDWSSAAAYNTAFYGVVISEGDQFESNNASKSRFVRIEPDIAYSIFVWDNDNGILTIVDPEKGDQIEPSKGLTMALEEAGLAYYSGTNLPENLYDYEIIFSTMGCYCVD